MTNYQNHQLTQSEQGYRCQTCGWQWQSPPREECPGVRRFAYGTVPQHYVSATELHRRKLKPGGPIVGAYRRAKSPYDYLYFYDANIALKRPEATEQQLTALEKARQNLREKHTCKECGYYDESHGRSFHARKHHHTITNGLCSDCLRHQLWQNERASIEHTMHHLMESQDAPTFLVLDTETNGLPDHPAFQVVEIAVVDHCGNTLFHSLIKPDIAMPASASAINGITDTMLTDAPCFTEIWPRLLNLLCTHQIYCYNVSFDRAAILRTAQRNGLVAPEEIKRPDRWHCIMEMYATYHGEWSHYRNSWKWQPLSRARQELDVEQSDQHRALGDALTTLSVMKTLATRAASHQMHNHTSTLTAADHGVIIGTP